MSYIGSPRRGNYSLFCAAPARASFIICWKLDKRLEAAFSANTRLTSNLNTRRHGVDLVCQEARLVIEIDGPEHNHRVAQRTWMRRRRKILKIRVIVSSASGIKTSSKIRLAYGR